MSIGVLITTYTVANICLKQFQAPTGIEPMISAMLG